MASCDHQTSDLRPHWHMRMTSSKYVYRIRKTSSSGYGPLINPRPSIRKISYKHNYVDLYSGVVFVFFQKRFGLGLKIGLGLGLGLGLGFRVRVRDW